jgi:hypothetical protein
MTLLGEAVPPRQATRDDKLAFLRRDLTLPPIAVPGALVVAGMATMPSREVSFQFAFASIVRQVDKLYLYLDGHDDVPPVVRGHANVDVVFARDMPGLHANGKLLGLTLEQRDCIYVCVDDDIYFPRHFVSAMREGLAKEQDRAVVGLHAVRLARPLVRFFTDQVQVSHYAFPLPCATVVDLVGTGAAMFSSTALKFDVRGWPRVSMADIGLAMEAARRELPMISIARNGPLVINLAEGQPDSLYLARLKDDSHQTALAMQLLAMRGAANPG